MSLKSFIYGKVDEVAGLAILKEHLAVGRPIQHAVKQCAEGAIALLTGLLRLNPVRDVDENCHCLMGPCLIWPIKQRGGDVYPAGLALYWMEYAHDLVQDRLTRPQRLHGGVALAWEG